MLHTSPSVATEQVSAQSNQRVGDLLYVFPCVILFLCFSVLLVLRLPCLGKTELILVLFVRLFGLCLSISSSSWGLGRAAVCDCGTPRTFLLPFLGRDVEN